MKQPKRMALLLLAASLVGCSSSSSSDKQGKTVAPPPAHFIAAKSSNPAGKYIELVGFRVNEESPGRLEIQFGAVNHSEADVGELKLLVNLSTSAAKPGDPPLISFPAKVSLGPSDMKNVKVLVPSKLRVYELPDWQFLTADFQISE